MRIKNWREYWSAQTTPRHRRDDAEFFSRYASELNVIIRQSCTPRSVLDLGCGNGAFYNLLHFDEPGVDFVGVDFSPSMLADFRRQHPQATLVAADAATFFSQRTFDLIFSSGLVQYFSKAALEEHFALCREMMNDSSVLLHTGIPWARQKWLYRAGWGPGSQPYPRNRLKRYLRPLYSAWKEQIGHWHRPQQLAAVAARLGMSCQIFGSTNYIYRFHALLRK